jgi:hypothetical protein
MKGLEQLNVGMVLHDETKEALWSKRLKEICDFSPRKKWNNLSVRFEDVTERDVGHLG